jgi:hypothetical protein
MPVRINCPSCQTTLAMPESMFGKPVRCPSCKQAFQCPPDPAAVRPAAVPRAVPMAPPVVPWAPPPPPPPAPPRADPFDLDAGQPAPAPLTPPSPPSDGGEGGVRGRAGFDWGEVDEPGGRASLPRGWRRVRQGFAYLLTSALVSVVGTVMIVWLTAVMIESGGGTAGGLAPLVLLALCGVASLVLWLVGLRLCCAIPRETGAQGVIVASTTATWMTIGAIGLLTLLTLISSAADNQKAALVSYPVMFFAMGFLMAALILFLFFLLLVAFHLKERSLATSVISFVVFVFAAPWVVPASVLLLAILAGKGMSWPALLDTGRFLLLAVQLVGVGWFIGLLYWEGAAIDRALRGARSY